MKDAPQTLKMEDLDQSSELSKLTRIKEKTRYMLQMSGVYINGNIRSIKENTWSTCDTD